MTYRASGDLDHVGHTRQEAPWGGVGQGEGEALELVDAQRLEGPPDDRQVLHPTDRGRDLAVRRAHLWRKEGSEAGARKRGGAQSDSVMVIRCPQWYPV